MCSPAKKQGRLEIYPYRLQAISYVFVSFQATEFYHRL